MHAASTNVCMRTDYWSPSPWRRFARVHMMVEGRADDRSKKSSRREYLIRNRPRHTATDRRRGDSARAHCPQHLSNLSRIRLRIKREQVCPCYQQLDEIFKECYRGRLKKSRRILNFNVENVGSERAYLVNFKNRILLMRFDKNLRLEVSRQAFEKIRKKKLLVVLTTSFSFPSRSICAETIVEFQGRRVQGLIDKKLRKK